MENIRDGKLVNRANGQEMEGGKETWKSGIALGGLREERLGKSRELS